jgi:hypothetical protein
MHSDWGSVSGDDDADAIMRDRRDERRVLNWAVLICSLPFIPCLIWYALTGSRVALAVVLFQLAGIVGSAIERAIFSTHTFVMIAEQRVRRVEERLDRVDDSVRQIERQLNPRWPE